MSSKPESPATISDRPSAHSTWQRRFFMVLTILGWLALAAAIIWGLAKIIGPLVLVGFSALLAYLIFPLVRFFQRHMPRPLAILVSLLVVLAVIGLILYVLVFAAVQQFGQLIGFITDLIQHPQNYPPFQSFLTWLQGLGLSQDQIHTSAQQILGDLQQAISGVVPIVGSIFLTSITLLLVATLTVYFMIDGPRVNSWLRQKTPVKARQFLTMFLDELDRSLGGFVRGQVLLATIMMVVVGLGAFLIGVPYVFLLALIVFVCEFIPQIGAYISGAIGIGFASSTASLSPSCRQDWTARSCLRASLAIPSASIPSSPFLRCWSAPLSSVCWAPSSPARRPRSYRPSSWPSGRPGASGIPTSFQQTSRSSSLWK